MTNSESHSTLSTHHAPCNIKIQFTKWNQQRSTILRNSVISFASGRIRASTPDLCRHGPRNVVHALAEETKRANPVSGTKPKKGFGVQSLNGFLEFLVSASMSQRLFGPSCRIRCPRCARLSLENLDVGNVEVCPVPQVLVGVVPQVCCSEKFCSEKLDT